jgi:SHAQKYF class myb-like DNA-binding protein
VKIESPPNSKVNAKNSKLGGASSSSHLPSHNTPWTEEENKAFEDGLRLYGRGSWKEISLIIKTRNALQVKNHARQYFKRVCLIYNSLTHFLNSLKR